MNFANDFKIGADFDLRNGYFLKFYIEDFLKRMDLFTIVFFY